MKSWPNIKISLNHSPFLETLSLSAVLRLRELQVQITHTPRKPKLKMKLKLKLKQKQTRQTSRTTFNCYNQGCGHGRTPTKHQLEHNGQVLAKLGDKVKDQNTLKTKQTKKKYRKPQ